MTSKRDQIRGAILNATQRKKITVEFFGNIVEVRQPTLGEVLASTEGASRQETAVNMIIGYCYVPGTDEKVFEEADREGLLALPFGEDLLKVQKAISKLTEVDTEAASGNS